MVLFRMRFFFLLLFVTTAVIPSVSSWNHHHHRPYYHYYDNSHTTTSRRRRSGGDNPKKAKGKAIVFYPSSLILLSLSSSSPYSSSSPPPSKARRRKPKQGPKKRQQGGGETATDDATKKKKEQQPSSSLKTIAAATTRYIAAKAIREPATNTNRRTPKKVFPLRQLTSDPMYLEQEDQRDRSFMRLLVSTVERRKGQIDKVLSYCISRRKTSWQKEQQQSKEGKKNDDGTQKPKVLVNPRDRFIQATLRLGVAQLLFLDIPSYAAVKETVDVLRMDPKLKFSDSQIKFVNGILRRIDREDPSLFLGSVTSPEDNVNPWLLQQCKSAWGEETTRKMIEIFMSQSPIYLSVNYSNNHKNYRDKQQEQEQYRREQQNKIIRAFAAADATTENKYVGSGDNINPIPTATTTSISNNSNGNGVCKLLPHGSIRVPDHFSGTISSWPLYDTGQWFVQDPAAAVPAIALYETLLSSRSDNGDNRHDKDPPLLRVLDLCAAPGGKTAQLLSLGFPSVTAVDIDSKRIKTLKSNLKRLFAFDNDDDQRCTVHTTDATTWIPTTTTTKTTTTSTPSFLFDGILVDVPCTATGTACKNPDVLQKNLGSSLDELLETQRTILNHCVNNLLAVNGIMIYSTCSILKQESEDQIERFLLNQQEQEQQQQKDGKPIIVKTIPFQPGEIPGLDDAIDENGWYRILPGALADEDFKQCAGFFVARLHRIQ